MRKQLLKGLTMLMAIVVLAMVTAVASANGQSLKANIPFEFAVGDLSLPAGAYTVNAIASDRVLRIRGVQTPDSAMRLTMGVEGKSKQARLVFHRYGDRYFLAEVWENGEGGCALLVSRQERAIQKELSRIASSKQSQRAYETVEIALAHR